MKVILEKEHFMEYSYKTEFGKLYDTYEQSKEMEIHRNLQALQSSFQIFERNFHELTLLLEPLKEPRKVLSLYTQDKSENVDALVFETKRLLHNFLASAKSLVDHTRVIVNRLYAAHEFKNEYQEKLEEDLANSLVQKFVQNLRNYTQHYTLPVLSLHITFSNDLNMGMKIDVNTLKKWDKWGSSIAYLEKIETDLCIETLVNEYFILIKNFYDWLVERQMDIHQADLGNLRKMAEEFMK